MALCITPWRIRSWGHSNRNVRKQSATDAGGEANPYGSVLSTPAYAALHFSGQVAKHQSPVRDQAAGMPITNTFQQNTQITQALRWLNERGPDAPRLVILRFEQVNTAGDNFGPDSPQYAAAVHMIDSAIGRLIDSLRQHGKLTDTDVIVVSDQGIAPIPGDHAVPLERIVQLSDVHVISDGQVLGITPLPGHESKVEAMVLGAHATYDCWRKQAFANALALRYPPTDPKHRLPNARRLECTISSPNN